MLLSDAPLHTSLRVRAINLEPASQLRMREIGLHDGITLSVSQRAGMGGRVVAIGSSRLGLDQATARLIVVEDASPLP